MIKKILSLILAYGMTLGMFSAVNVNAASPIVFDGTTQVLFDQSFGGFDSASDLTDFTVTGDGWAYEDYFMLRNGGWGEIETNSNYDVSNAASYTFSVKLSNTYGGYRIHLANANESGYVLKYERSTKKLTLHNYDVNSAELASVEIDAYGADITITAKYTKATNTLEVTNTANSNVLTYKPQDGTVPNLNGKFKVIGSYAGIFTVFNMKLTTSTDNITVNNWRYEKSFSDKDSIESLAEEGITFSAEDVISFNEDSVKYNISGRSAHVYIKPDNRNLSGDYAFEVKTSKEAQYHTIKFNYINESTYYELSAYRSYGDTTKNNKVVLIKHESGKDDVTLYNDSYSGLYIPNSVTVTYRVSVKNTDSGLKISTAITNNDNNSSFSFEVTDTAPFSNPGCIAVNGSYSGVSNLYYVNAWSLLSEGESTETVSYTENLMNKTFSKNDTIESLAKEGITFSHNDYITFDDNSVIYNYDDPNLGSKVYIKPENLTGDYEFEIKTSKSLFEHDIMFNCIDSNNYYVLTAYRYYSSGDDTGKIKLIKYEDGKDPVELANIMGTGLDIGNSATITYKVSVKNIDGSLEMDITVVNHSKSDATFSFEAKDSTPFAQTGYITLCGDYTGQSNLYSVKVSKSYSKTLGDAESFMGIFYKDAGVNAITEMEKGAVYFDYPVSMLGNHIVTAVLYEDYKMTDIKVLEPVDLYSGVVKLFDTTNSMASDLKVRVYFFDGADKLNTLTEVYELN